MGGRDAWTRKVDPDRLRTLVAKDMTVAAIGRELGVSPTTVRYWMDREGLRTKRGRRLAATKAARATGAATTTAVCEIHGNAVLVQRPGGGYRCLACRNAAVTARRRRIKLTLIEEAGGRCVLCGYDRCAAALHFHHLDPAEKAFPISGAGATRAIGRARAEVSKCVLLCANCHAEVEVGVRQVTLPGRVAPKGAPDPG